MAAWRGLVGSGAGPRPQVMGFANACGGKHLANIYFKAQMHQRTRGGTGRWGS